jgi:hypothetical protein
MLQLAPAAMSVNPAKVADTRDATKKTAKPPHFGAELGGKALSMTWVIDRPESLDQRCTRSAPAIGPFPLGLSRMRIRPARRLGPVDRPTRSRRKRSIPLPTGPTAVRPNERRGLANALLQVGPKLSRVEQEEHSPCRETRPAEEPPQSEEPAMLEAQATES